MTGVQTCALPICAFLIIGPQDLPAGSAIAVVVVGLVALFVGIFKTHEIQVAAAPHDTDRAGTHASKAAPTGDSDSGLIVVVLIALVAYWYLPVSNHFRDRIAVYRLDCDSPLATEPGKCAGPWHAAAVTTFIVSTEHQFVVSLTEGMAAPERLSKCVVADRTNWSCQGPEDSLTLTMRDGDLEFGELGVARPDVKFVSRLKWWWVKVSPAKSRGSDGG